MFVLGVILAGPQSGVAEAVTHHPGAIVIEIVGTVLGTERGVAPGSLREALPAALVDGMDLRDCGCAILRGQPQYWSAFIVVHATQFQWSC